VTTGAVAFLGKSSRLAIRVALVIWVIAAAVWWAADWPMWWGPEPSFGLVAYAVLGAVMIQARFAVSDRTGGSGL
jgi:hypothetical protein